MTAAALMRDAAVLGADCAASTPADQVPNAEQGWTVHPERRAFLVERLRRQENAPDPMLRRLRDDLGLDRPSAWLAVLCSSVEIYPEAAAAVSIIGEDHRVQLVTPTVFARLACAFLDLPFVEALVVAIDGGASRRAGLIEVLEPFPGLPHTHQALRFAAGELRALLTGSDILGTSAETERKVIAPARGVAFEDRLVSGTARLLAVHGTLVLRAASRRAGRQFACDLATVLGVLAHVVTIDEEAPSPDGLGRTAGTLVVLDCHTRLSRRPMALAWLRRFEGKPSLVVAIVPDVVDGLEWPILDVGQLGHKEAVRAWRTLLEAEPAAAMAACYRVGTAEISMALQEARVRQAIDGNNDATPNEAAIAERIRAQGARRMGPHVGVLEPRCGLSHLVVPGAVRGKLDEIVTAYRMAHHVFVEMGVIPHTSLGKGISCLFSGKPGTGKTFAAQCLASELELNLYRIDLSQVVSKYIGETEKALAALFDEAEAGHGILLFDEADALFGKRSEVKDAHDRYANIEVGYLLQRMESFEGVAILTTNLQGNIDAAFIRRLRFVIEFPIPDKVLRRQLWEQSLPGPAWRAGDLDLDTLAERFALSGGNIQNIGIAAAHLAAACPSGRITNVHLVRATVRELEKTGRPCSAPAFGTLAPLLAEIPA
jgi:hypothetical protein